MSYMRRTSRCAVRDHDDALATVMELHPATLVGDVQPFAAAWGCDSETMMTAIITLSQRLADASPDLNNLVFATNAHSATDGLLCQKAPRVMVVSAARKPWRTDYLAEMSQPVVVLGDQILTDRLLARHVRGLFLHWQSSRPISWWPRVQAMIGGLFTRLRFSPILLLDSPVGKVR